MAWGAKYIAGALNPSKKISAVFSRLAEGLSGASVKSTWEVGEKEKKRNPYSMFLAGNIQILSGVNVRPDPFHVTPVLDDPILHRIGQKQCSTVLLCSGPDKSVEKLR
jgi:hypothetical protein